MKNKVIIFDMDGVIFDSIGFAMENFFKAVYPDFTFEIYKELLCGNVHEEIRKINLSRKVETDKERDIRREKYSEAKSKIPMFDGIKEFLENLNKSGYILVINTSAINKNCLPVLEYSKSINLFDLIAGAELSESKVEKFKIIQEKYKADKKDMLFVTDTLGDVREADVAGISTIAVTWGAHDESFFEREKHSNLIGIVNTVEELDKFIRKY